MRTPLSALSSITDERMSEAHMAREEEEEGKKSVSMRQRKTDRVGEQTGY